MPFNSLPPTSFIQLRHRSANFKLDSSIPGDDFKKPVSEKRRSPNKKSASKFAGNSSRRSAGSPQSRQPSWKKQTNTSNGSKKAFKAANLQESPLAERFHEACVVTLDRVAKETEKEDNPNEKNVTFAKLMASAPGSVERTEAWDHMILQMISALRFIIGRYSREVIELVQTTEKDPHLNALEVLEEFKQDFMETSKHYSDYENDWDRFTRYVENPPLVPSLGRIYAVAENVELKDNSVPESVMRLISASYLRFFRARLRISSFKSDPRINMTNPGEWYPRARAMTRKVILHIGPTNSGKTYNALKALEAAESGYYAGPLRLLAREVYNRMKTANKKCNLITGEEVIEDYDEYGMPVKVSSGTVEMVDITNPMDVAVIDEIQMIEDSGRGWAWTQAFLGLQAKEIHLCGDPSSESVVRDLVRIAGDTLEVKRYQRLSPLTVERKALMGDLKLLRPGDCLIAFSKKDLFDWKVEIEKHRAEKCAIIYGALPPESRSKQANSFNDPDSDIHFLVASDAVGMGLNLSIKRIVFYTVTKFDGKSMGRVSVSQIKQIAGRAGRFQVPGVKASADNTASGGTVTAMHPRDLKYIGDCMQMNTPIIRKAGLFASESLFRLYASSFSSQRSFDQVLENMEITSELNPMFYLCGVENMTEIAGFFKGISGLALNERITLSKAPVKTQLVLVVAAFKRFCTVIAKTESLTLLDVPEVNLGMLNTAADHRFKITDIAGYETLHSIIVLYLWLSYRFPMNFRDREGAMELKALCEDKIDQALMTTRSARLAKWRQKVKSQSNVI